MIPLNSTHISIIIVIYASLCWWFINHDYRCTSLSFSPLKRYLSSFIFWKYQSELEKLSTEVSNYQLMMKICSKKSSEIEWECYSLICSHLYYLESVDANIINKKSSTSVLFVNYRRYFYLHSHLVASFTNWPHCHLHVFHIKSYYYTANR